MSIFQQIFDEHEASFLFQPFFITIVTIFFMSVLFRWFFKSSNKSENLPPSPPKLPIIGNLHQIGIFRHHSLSDLAKRYGPLMLLHFGKVPVLIVSSADAAREVMKTHDIIFANRPKSTPFEILSFGCKDVTMAPYGDYWRQIRSICVLHLLSNKQIHYFNNIRAEEAALMVEKIEVCASSSSPINLSQILITLTNDIVCRIFFGRKYSGEDDGSNKFRKYFDNFSKVGSSFHVGDFIPWLGWVSHLNGLNARIMKTAKDLDNFLDGVVEEHEKRRSAQVVEDDHNKDFVDVLLWVQKQNVFGFPIDRIIIKAIILDLLAAGTDTTYTVLEWTMAELLRHPKIMKEVQDEVRGIVGDKSEITEADLDKMHYLNAVIKETLRVHVPVPLLVPRRSTQDVKINGYHIAAGTNVYINAAAIAKDPSSWDQPEEFKPERFFNSPINFYGHDFQFLPFGAGRRGCPGTQFGVRVDELALATLLNNFDWTPQEDMDMTEAPGLTIHKKIPMIAFATPYSR